MRYVFSIKTKYSINKDDQGLKFDKNGGNYSMIFLGKKLYILLP